MDFKNEANQQLSRTIPAGSKVLVGLSVIPPKQAVTSADPLLSEAQNGLRSLFVRCQVTNGTYAGQFFFDRIWAPTFLQTIELSEGQKKACARGGAILRAILEAAHGIAPDDEEASRDIESFMELQGLKFPVIVGLNPTPVEKNGIVYWNNTLHQVVTPGDPDYKQIMGGGEVLTNGPTTCSLLQNRKSVQANESEEAESWSIDASF